jgi:hypothetical protein
MKFCREAAAAVSVVLTVACGASEDASDTLHPDQIAADYPHLPAGAAEAVGGTALIGERGHIWGSNRTASAFAVRHDGMPYIVTAEHVLDNAGLTCESAAVVIDTNPDPAVVDPYIGHVTNMFAPSSESDIAILQPDADFQRRLETVPTPRLFSSDELEAVAQRGTAVFVSNYQGLEGEAHTPLDVAGAVRHPSSFAGMLVGSRRVNEEAMINGIRAYGPTGADRLEDQGSGGKVVFADGTLLGVSVAIPKGEGTLDEGLIRSVFQTDVTSGSHPMGYTEPLPAEGLAGLVSNMQSQTAC